MAAFSEDFLSGDDLETALATFYCYDYDYGIASYITTWGFIEAYSVKYVLIYFDEDVKKILITILMYLPIMAAYIYNGNPELKSIFGFSSYKHTMFWVISQEQHYKMMFIENFKTQNLLSKTKLIVAKLHE